MEHGAQIHTPPASQERLAILARRCGYTHADDPVAPFISELQKHTAEVRAVYNRVFVDAPPTETRIEPEPRVAPPNENARLIREAASRLSKVIASGAGAAHDVEQTLVSALPNTINASRSLRNLAAWATSFATFALDQTHSAELRLGGDEWSILIERLTLVLSSQYLAHLLIARPTLSRTLACDTQGHRAP